MTVIIDSRETKHMVQKIMKAVPDAKVETLNYGDYIVMGEGKQFVIERKTIQDLFASLNDGRLWEQLKGMEKFDGYKKILLIEGNLYFFMKMRKDINVSRYIATLVSIEYGWNGFEVINLSNQYETSEFIRRLNDKVGNISKEKYSIPLGIKKEGRTVSQEQIDVIRGFDGIGETKAEKLLEALGTIRNIIDADEKTLKKIIAEKDAKRIVKISKLKFKKGKK